MKRKICRLACLTAVVCLSVMFGCSKEDDTGTVSTNVSSTSNQSTTPTTNQSAPVTTGAPKIGTLKAEPNPIRVCDGTGTGKTAILWNTKGASRIQIRVGSPNGGLLADTTQTQGKAETGNWVTDGATFYLQDLSDGRPPSSANTIATVTVKVTNAGCGK